MNDPLHDIADIVLRVEEVDPCEGIKAALIEGWTWLWDNCEEGIIAHEECGSFEQRWFEKLREYERCHGGSGKRDGRMGPGWGAGRIPQHIQQEMFATEHAARIKSQGQGEENGDSAGSDKTNPHSPK